MTNPLPDWAIEQARAEADYYARWLNAGNSAGQLSEHAIDGLVDSIAHSILSAYQQGKQDGRREMKEREAEVADAIGQRAKTIDGQRTGLAIAAAIRRLDEVQDDAG